MEVFAAYLAKIADPIQRARVEEILRWILTEFPNLQPRIAWNQPMFTDHGTFIIGFSISKGHLAVTPEEAVVALFSAAIVQAGYTHTRMLFRIPWDRPVDYGLLRQLIEYNIRDKAAYTSFWR
ncbi:MAG: iron chaperone [Anaerolineae bacterium]